MREAMANGRMVVAGPVSPEKALCPSCSGVVTKRKRRRMNGQVTYFYGHKRGAGIKYPQRSYP